MYRSPFTHFRKPHELLSTMLHHTNPHTSFSHSRARNRSVEGNLLADSDAEEARDAPSRSRSVSPPWQPGESATSIPLLPVEDELRLGEGPPPRSGWMGGGKLGGWLWGTQKGWLVYVMVLIAAYSAASLALLVMNRFILWTGVYKFGYPITTTLLQLLFTQSFLFASASITRSFSRSLHALGLGCVVAPKPRPSKGKRRAEGGGLRDFATRLRPTSTDSIFETKWVEAKQVLPLAVIYSLKIMLSNLSFAYTQLQIYQVSRVGSLLWTLVLTHFFHRSQALTVTTLSSCITMVLSLTMVSLRPGTRFAVEGFVAGFFSSFFVASYPILLAHTYRVFSVTAEDATRAAWKLLHLTNTLAILFLLPCALVSGELRDISRNCYFLDVAFFWLMMLGAGAAAWATFVVGFLMVRAVTPLTMVVVTYPRSALQTVLIMGFKLPTWSWVGVLMCWGSGVWYLVGRRRECGVSFYHIEETREERRRRLGRGRGVSVHAEDA